jgi:glycosyltransferase involved in cell wall biosynthesis
MFLLDDIAPVPYADPWLQPLQTRLQMLAAGRTRIAYFYEQPDNSTFRYRVYNMTRVINDGTGDLSAAYFFLADLRRMQEIVEIADMLVICRTRYDHQVNRLISSFHRLGKRVLFDIDDFVFNVDYVHLLVESLDIDVENPQVWQDWFAYLSRLGATLKRCDGAIATTAPLAAHIREFAGIPVAIVPNFMNQEQLELSERVRNLKRSQTPGQSGLIHLGYFSGSPSHNRDFAMVSPALEHLLEADPRLGVVVVGYIEAGPTLERFGSRVQRFPFHDYVNLQRLVGSVEFNLMPLHRNSFTNCKSELKYFEAAAAGSVSIASPTDTYAQAISHGCTGFISRAHEWQTVLRQVLDRIDEYEKIAARATADALARFSWVHQRPAIIAALGLD